MHMEAGGAVLTPENWSSRWLWADWCVGWDLNLKFSEKVLHIRHCWTICWGLLKTLKKKKSSWCFNRLKNVFPIKEPIYKSWEKYYSSAYVLSNIKVGHFAKVSRLGHPFRWTISPCCLSAFVSHRILCACHSVLCIHTQAQFYSLNVLSSFRFPLTGRLPLQMLLQIQIQKSPNHI